MSWVGSDLVEALSSTWDKIVLFRSNENVFRVGEDGFAELGVSNEMFLDVDIPSLHVGY